MTTIERPHIETVGTFVNCRRELDKADLCFIGEFTRENISRWLDKCYWFEMGVYGYEDFHAVCGDIDIPWAAEGEIPVGKIVYRQAPVPQER